MNPQSGFLSFKCRKFFYFFLKMMVSAVDLMRDLATESGCSGNSGSNFFQFRLIH
jgi:hypothetical protein